jgi:hypothetical protein
MTLLKTLKILLACALNPGVPCKKSINFNILNVNHFSPLTTEAVCCEKPRKLVDCEEISRDMRRKFSPPSHEAEIKREKHNYVKSFPLLIRKL